MDRRWTRRRTPDETIRNPACSNPRELAEHRRGSNFADTIPLAQIPTRASIYENMETSHEFTFVLNTTI
jgi:hypothetical protein